MDVSKPVQRKFTFGALNTTLLETTAFHPCSDFSALSATEYHHGASLVQTVIGLAQDFGAGNNNI